MEQLCLFAEGELGERVPIPIGYQPSAKIPDLTTDEWRERVHVAVSKGELSRDVGEKVLHSIERMPDLLPEQRVSVSYSGGKDSGVIFILARMKYAQERILALFADTDDEWPESYPHIDEFEAWIGVTIHRLKSCGIHTLLREKIPVWPRPGRRHCTKVLKMEPQRDWLDRQGYDQIRKDGRPARFRKNVGGEVVKVIRPAPLLLAGERWAESESRASLPVENRDDVIMRMTHRPAVDWTLDNVWEFLHWMQAPINPVYGLGIKRVACAGCIFANPKELALLGEYHPDRLMAWVETERIIGHPWKGNVSIKQIYDRLETSARLGSKAR